MTETVTAAEFWNWPAPRSASGADELARLLDGNESAAQERGL